MGAVVQDGRVEAAACAGLHGSISDQYRIGSITKSITAVLVLQCRRDGLVALDDPIGRVLPETGYGDATVRDLLAHTAGLQAEPVGPWWERNPGIGTAELLARNDGSGRVFAAREAFHYSNLGFALLGEAVARLRGCPWADLVADRVTGPLQMTRTTYLPQDPHAQGYSVDHFAGTLTPEPHADTGAMAPAGQLWSTLDDLARFLDFLATGHPDVLDDDSIAAMAVRGAPGLDYGLGLRLVAGMVGHTGSMPGFLAAAFVDRRTRRGAVALANATTGLATDSVAAALLHDDPDPVEPWVPSESVPADVADLLGLWFWGNTAHEMRWENGHLELRVLGDGRDLDVFERAGDGWRGSAGYLLGERLEVAKGPEGTPDHLECATFVFTRAPYPDRP